MNINNRRKILLLIWLLILFTGPVTVLLNSQGIQLFENQNLLINFFQRIFGLVAFILLFFQILIGSNMGKWVQLMGGKAYKIHITQGLFAYGLVLIHPLLYFLLTYRFPQDLILFFIPSFSTELDIYLNLGKLGLIILSLGVIAGYFRTKPFFRRNWRSFHLLNYVSFMLIAIHAWFIGSDTHSWPFKGVYIISVILVILIIVYKYLFKFSEIRKNNKIPIADDIKSH